jgi:hypothetical protein
MRPWKSWKFDNFEVNVQYYFPPAFWLGGAYTYTCIQLDSTLGNFSPQYHHPFPDNLRSCASWLYSKKSFMKTMPVR